MGKYFKIRNEFLHFVEQFRDQSLNQHFATLLNMIVKNFDDVASCGTSGGKRAKLLYELIQEESQKLTDQLYKPSEDEESDEVVSLIRLHTLQVEKFRGFTHKQNFSLEKQFILIYGANGSGKSSFCEALEFCLLGDVNEAHKKRITVQDYIKNSDHAAYISPVLTGVDSNGVLVTVKNNYDLFHFCFIEKSRIDAFARISSHTPADQTGLISLLFGLEDFNNFVKEFTENIENYIPQESQKEKDYKIKLLEVENHKKNKALYEDELNKINDRKALIAKESKVKDSFSELNRFINGSEASIGRLKEIKEAMQKEQPGKVEYKKSAILMQNAGELKLACTTLETRQEEFIRKINEINLADFYKTLLQIENDSVTSCPACETPLSQAITNPFENARNKIQDLQSVSQLQIDRDNAWNIVVEKTNAVVFDTRQLIDVLKKKSKAIGITLPKELLQTNPGISESSTYLSKLRLFIDDFISKKEALLIIETEFDQENVAFEQHQTQKQKLLDEQEQLTNLNKKISAIDAEEKNFKGLIQKAKDEIQTFESDNEQVLKDIETEKAQIDINIRFIEAYKHFREKLLSYKEKLPLTLSENLNSLIKEFYNEINKDDHEFDLLAEVVLPTKANEIIKISFRDNPGKFVNALHVLSEGHIKCLGLSILLAKSVSSGFSILIFDDVVNAIDDEHRYRISELLFKNEHFQNKQILLTSHSEEFIKDVENHMFTKNECEKFIGKIIFNKRTRKRIEPSENSFNYLKRAEESLSDSNKRDCLGYIRRALESTSDHIWRRLINFENRKYNVEITLVIRHPARKPDLMNVITGLRSFLPKLQNPQLNLVKEHLEWFEGLKTTSPRIWEYLNKGTHDETDKDDFDKAIVKQILDKAITLETIAKGKWN
jgi:recombinational DNA repair ATPase RecF